VVSHGTLELLVRVLATQDALRSGPEAGFPDPDLVDHFAHSGRRLLTPTYPGSMSGLAIRLLLPTLDLDNPHSSSTWPR